MKVCNFLLFGHGRDGEEAHEDYDDSGRLFIQPKTTLHVTGIDGQPKTAMHSLDAAAEYIVVAHKSVQDGKTYLIGTLDGKLPPRIDDRIRAAHLEPSPY